MNFADLDNRYKETPPELVGMYPLGGGGILEAPYRHYFEFKHLKKIVQFNKSMNILELGSGNGRWAISIAPLVASYTGIDLTHQAVQIAIDETSRRKLKNVHFKEMSILDFEGDRYYDVIYFSSVSQYLDDDEISRVLLNLKPWMKTSTKIIDRSTLSYTKRHIDICDNYRSIWRTPDELRLIFKPFGFNLNYYKPSYNYLRFPRFFIKKPFRKILSVIFRITSPFSFYLMHAMTVVADFIKPISILDRGWSHDFILFTQDGDS